jgi:hypothetical protein
MLVGVGGSGKQSLARLAAHISGYDVFQIAVSSTYGVADFKEALLSLYTKVGSVAHVTQPCHRTYAAVLAPCLPPCPCAS